jgi:tetratricopeptide (TPR) repeat protein
MEIDRHRRIARLFRKACDLGSEERKEFLAEACAGDPDLRQQLESLLRHKVEATATSGWAERHPSSIGSYRILGILGEGSQGIVYKAVQRFTRRLVALKILRGGPFLGEHGARRFEREIQALAAFRHPGIATIYEAGQTEDGRRFFSMELAEGVRIDEFVRRKDLDIRERLELFKRVCDAVQHAHEKGIIHRDLKPGNIILDDHGQPKILDFGLVRMIEADAKRASTSLGSRHVVGSLGYMSPEQAQGKTEDVGPPTDVYSLGVILFELLTGKPPYDIGDSLPNAVLTICQTPPLCPAAVNRKLRGDLQTIILKALEKEPSQRFQSVAEMVADIRRHLDGEPISIRSPSRLYSVCRGLRRHPAVAIACGVTIVVGIAGWSVGAWWKQQSHVEARIEACLIDYQLASGPAERILADAQSLSDRYPDLPEATLVLARATFAAAEPLKNHTLRSEAILSLKRRIEEGGPQWPLQLLLADLCDETNGSGCGRLRAAANGEAGNEVDDWILRSLATLDPREAATYAETAAELDPEDPVALARLAFTCESSADVECSLAAARDLARSGDLRWVWFEGLVLSKHGRHREAIARYESLRRLNPALSARLQAISHLCLAEYEEAIASYTEAIELNPKTYYGWDRYRRATARWIAGHLDEAEADYSRFRSMTGHVSYADARLLLLRHDIARHLESQGRFDGAMEILRKAQDDLRTARDGVQAGSWLDSILKCLVSEISPEDLVARADPANAEHVCEAYYYAGEACLLRGETGQARAWFQRCVDTGLVFDPDEYSPNPMNEYHLALWRLKGAGTNSR